LADTSNVRTGPPRLDANNAADANTDPSSQPAVRTERRYVRVAGPFEGHRVAASIETPVQIYDVNEGGCFVTSMHTASAGRPIELKIDLPGTGWIAVKGDVLYTRPPFGYAVGFTRLSDEVLARLKSALDVLRAGPTR
jgi:hypothetical protein